MSRIIKPCPGCGEVDDIENCDLCRRRVLSRTASKKRRDAMRADPDYVPSRRPQIPIRNNKPSRFTAATRNLTLLSGDKLERELNRICDTW